MTHPRGHPVLGCSCVSGLGGGTEQGLSRFAEDPKQGEVADRADGCAAIQWHLGRRKALQSHWTCHWTCHTESRQGPLPLAKGLWQLVYKERLRELRLLILESEPDCSMVQGDRARGNSQQAASEIHNHQRPLPASAAPQFCGFLCILKTMRYCSYLFLTSH